MFTMCMPKTPIIPFKIWSVSCWIFDAVIISHCVHHAWMSVYNVFFLLFVFQWLQQLHGPKWPNTTRANSFSADDLNRFHSLYLHVLHVRLCSIFGGFFGSRQNLKWKTSNNLIRLMSFCLATIFTLTSDTLNCWVISPVSKMAIEQRIHSNRCVSRSHVAAMVNDIY